MLKKFGIVLVLLMVSQVLHAQQAAVNENAPAATKIYLKSGKVVEGEIVSYDAVSVVLKDPSLGLMTISRENILSRRKRSPSRPRSSSKPRMSSPRLFRPERSSMRKARTRKPL